MKHTEESVVNNWNEFKYNILKIFGTVLIAMFLQLGTVIWWAAKFDNKVSEHQNRVDNFILNYDQKSIYQLDERVTHLVDDVDELQERFDRMIIK